MAAANATNAAASSAQLTCCTPTSTSGLVHFPSPPTVPDITKPRYSSCAHDPDPGWDPKSDPDPDPELRSKLLVGLVNGVAPLIMSIPILPPFLVLMVELTNVMASVAPSGMISKRYPSSPLRSRHASRRPHGFHVLSPGRRMSQDPGLDLLTRSEPCDGTNGVTIDAAATGEPERSCTVIDHPFRSFTDISLSDVQEPKQLVDVLGSDNDDL